MPALSFSVDVNEISADGIEGIFCFFEAVKLGMIFIAFSFSGKNFLREQTFAPKRY
jgi:hypothetical protein